MNLCVNQQNYAPQFGSVFNLKASKGIFSEKEMQQIIEKGNSIGCARNIINCTIEGDVNKYNLAMQSKLYASRTGSPMHVISEPREYTKYANGTPFSVCMRKLDGLAQRCVERGYYA